MIRYLVLCIACLWAHGLNAQYRFQRLSSAEGLSQSSIQAILQDHKGFMWFGTMDGLNRYDGYNFKIYRSDFKNTKTLSNNDIRAIFEDSRGKIWIGTAVGGINVLNLDTEQVQRFSTSEEGIDIRHLEVNDFAEDQNGIIWVSTLKGLFMIDQHRKIRRCDVIPAKGYSSVLVDQKHRIWAASTNGEVLVKTSTSDNFQIIKWSGDSMIRPTTRIPALYETKAGRILVCTPLHGLFAFDEQQQYFYSVSYFAGEYEGRNLMRSIAEDHKGKLWIASDAGLLKLDATDFSFEYLIKPDPRKGLESHATQSICVDAFENIWVGIWDGGINILFNKQDNFAHFSIENGLPAKKITGIGENAEDVFVATGRGLMRYNLKNGASQIIFPGEDITLLKTKGKQVFISIWNKGFYFSDDGGKSFVHYAQLPISDPSTPPRVHMAEFSQQGHLWLVSSNGKLMRFFPATKKITLEKKGDLGVTVTSLAETKDGLLWMGTYNQGLWLYHPLEHRVSKYDLSKDATNDSNQKHINTLWIDRKNMLWVGTSGSGLFLLDAKRNQFRQFTTKDGLPNDVIKGILDDAKGNLWVATNEGICRVDIKRKNFRTYTSRDGLNGKEFIPNVAYLGSGGRMYFGGMHGLNFFQPAEIVDDLHQPKVYFTELRLLNELISPRASKSPLQKSIDETSILKLGYHQATSITLEFVALYFRPNNQCTYRYKLEGFNSDWVDAGKQRNATYTNLSPGRYTFRVKAANSDGVWDKRGRSLEIWIAPPLYLSWPAMLVYFVISIIILLFYQNHIRKREFLKSQLRIQAIETTKFKELDQMKTSFFTNLSHELRTPLTLILDPIDQLINQPKMHEDHMKDRFMVIQRNANRLVRLVNQLLDLSKIDANKFHLHIDEIEIHSFLEKIVSSFQYQAEKKDVTLDFVPQFSNQMIWCDGDALEKILYNLLSNAIKASKAGGQVCLEASITEESPKRLFIQITDDGIGIAPEQISHLFQRFYQVESQRNQTQLGTGIGLALTKELIKFHGGDIQVNSSLGTGTTFSFDIQIDKGAFPPSWLGAAPDQQQWMIVDDVKKDKKIQELKKSSHNEIVLIAEDNAEMREYLERNLAENHTVLSAENGKIALELALQYLPNLIISDLLMPEMDGFELCQAIKNDEKTSHIPFVLLTSRSVVESQLQGLAKGADDYLTKPFQFRFLQARIKNLLEQRERLQQHFLTMLKERPVLLTPNESSNHDAAFLQKIVQTIEENIADVNFNVDRLEVALSMSKMQLYRKLTSLTGMSGNAFIRHIRLMRAKQLLENNSLTVAEVAYQVGFNSPSYFTRAFKKEFGKLPSSTSVRLN